MNKETLVCNEILPGEIASPERLPWNVYKEGIDIGGALCIEILRSDDRPECVDLQDIAAKRLSISGDSIPTSKHQLFTTLVNQLYDCRIQIKRYVERNSEFRLTCIDMDGLSSRLGGSGKTAGFALRQTVAGLRDDELQAKMAAGLFRSVVARHTVDHQHVIESKMRDLAQAANVVEAAVDTPAGS